MTQILLVADDSVTIQKVVELTFSDSNMRVVGVGDGQAALEAVQSLSPAVVLCDVIMPEVNGYDVCQQIKTDPATANTPVLLLTGAFEPFDEERAKRCGADGHLTKPFESRLLLERVEAVLLPTGGGMVPEPEVMEAPAREGDPGVPDTLPGEEELTFDGPVHSLRPEETPSHLDREDALAVPVIAEPPTAPGFAAEPVRGAGGSDPSATQPPGEISFRDVSDWLGHEKPAPEPVREKAEPTVSPLPPLPEDNPIMLEETGEAPAEPPPPVTSSEPAPVAGDLSRFLDDPELRRMVQNAVDRVAREAVQEVAWEVVPDLAEVILRKTSRGEGDHQS